MQVSFENGLRVAAWVVAGAWVWKLVSAVRGLPRVANLRDDVFDLPTRESVTVVVPARNEAKDIRECLVSLLDQDSPVQIIAVNDRSEDATGSIMNELASTHPGRLTVLHVVTLPAGWLGKTHAMAEAAKVASTDFLLFTDADIVFRPDALRRAVGCATRSRADHLVVMPTTIIRRWDEAVVLGFFQLLGLWAVRPWKVGVEGARDAIGVGAFNLVRREAYEAVGGFEALRMEVVEDLGFGRLVKRAGLRQQVAYGLGLVNVHWAAGARGIVNVMTKNAFSVFRFNVGIVLGSCTWLAVFCVGPFLWLWWRRTLVPGLVAVGCIIALYRVLRPLSGIAVRNAAGAPFAAGIFLFAVIRSTWTTLRQGGVVWRGTFYPLRELKLSAKALR